jgi:cytochrome c551/c552
MTKPLLVMFASLLIASATVAAEGNASAGNAKAAPCAACHGADGNSAAPNFPKLAGQGERYLVKQITDIKSGARSVPMMAGQTPISLLSMPVKRGVQVKLPPRCLIKAQRFTAVVLLIVIFQLAQAVTRPQAAVWLQQVSLRCRVNTPTMLLLS